MISGSDRWIMLELNRRGRSEKNEIGRRGPHGIGLEDDATHQFIIVFVAKSVYLRRRHVRACIGSDQGDKQLSEKKIVQREGVIRGFTLQLIQDVNMMSLDRFQADILATRAQNVKSDAFLVE